MIETHQSITIAAPIDVTWTYAKDVERWAEIMPGYRSCEILSDDDSLWTLKVGVGGLVRTVKVAVHVERWAGPEQVDFTFSLQGDPVTGGGSYTASATATGQTKVELAVQVRGSGPMAPMWEAMGSPVLPKFAQGFAEELKARIEAEAGTTAGTRQSAVVAAPRKPLLASLFDWIRQLFAR